MITIVAKMNLSVALKRSFVPYLTCQPAGYVDAFEVVVAKDKVKAINDIMFPVTLADVG